MTKKKLIKSKKINLGTRINWKASKVTLPKPPWEKKQK